MLRPGLLTSPRHFTKNAVMAAALRSAGGCAALRRGLRCAPPGLRSALGECAAAFSLEQVEIGGPRGAIGIGDRPPVLLAIWGPGRVRQCPERHHSDPWLP